MSKKKKLTKKNPNIKDRLKENPTVGVEDFTNLIKKSTQQEPFDKKK